MSGSSPHTRGAPRKEGLDEVPVGIIPAYAGSTASRSSSRRLTRDHPRIRGEHPSGTSVETWYRGSSPHTRGALAGAVAEGPGDGIIPAYAGSTPSRPRRAAARRDHPRIRGEHFSSVTKGLTDAGSSPHTRGAQAASSRADRDGGIIPAYAGST